MDILIYGAGITGIQAAAYLSYKSHNVTIYTRDSKKEETINREGLNLTGIAKGNYKVNVTTDLNSGLENVSYIMIFTKANAHSDVFKNLKGKLKENQRILIFNSNWGAYEGFKILHKELEEKKVILGETGSMPFMGSVEKIVNIKLEKIKEKTKISTIKEEDSQTLKEELSGVLKEIVTCKSIIETSITATNPIIHVPITLFNIARIENSDDFKFYGEGTSKSGTDYVVEIDKERIKLAKEFDINCPSIVDSINSFWETDYGNLYDALRKNYPNSKAPKKIDYRYLDEDVPFGLVPIVKLGELLGIDTPYTKAIVDLMVLFKKKDYYKIGVDLNLEELYKLK